MRLVTIGLIENGNEPPTLFSGYQARMGAFTFLNSTLLLLLLLVVVVVVVVKN